MISERRSKVINLTIRCRTARFLLCRNFVTHASRETTGESLFSATVTLLACSFVQNRIYQVDSTSTPVTPAFFNSNFCNYETPPSRNVKGKYQNETPTISSRVNVHLSAASQINFIARLFHSRRRRSLAPLVQENILYERKPSAEVCDR